MLKERGEFDRYDAAFLAAVGAIALGLFLRSLDDVGGVVDVLVNTAVLAGYVCALFLYAVSKWRRLDRRTRGD